MDAGRIDTSMVSRARVLPNELEAPHRTLVFPTNRLLFSGNEATTPTAPEWNAVEIELRKRLEKCDALLRRNGVHSAREEVMQGLLLLVRHIEALRNDELAHSLIQQPSLQSRKRRVLEPALQQAFITLEECADFHESIQYLPKRIDRMVEHHASTALKGQDLSLMTNELARQAYLEHAKKMFWTSSQRHPWAAELLYALGKTYERELQFDTTRPNTLRAQSVACLEAAHQIAPGYAYIANELGFNLTHMNRLKEAHGVLQTVLANEPSEIVWRNMAEVHRRRGDTAQAKFASDQADASSPR
jgi:tetratricopeptide (TPR) repeat protein